MHGSCQRHVFVTSSQPIASQGFVQCTPVFALFYSLFCCRVKPNVFFTYLPLARYFQTLLLKPIHSSRPSGHLLLVSTTYQWFNFEENGVCIPFVKIVLIYYQIMHLGNRPIFYHCYNINITNISYFFILFGR